MLNTDGIAGLDRLWTVFYSSVPRALRGRSICLGTGVRVNTSTIRISIRRGKFSLCPRFSADLQVLDAYAKGLGEKKWKLTENKLKEGEFPWCNSPTDVSATERQETRYDRMSLQVHVMHTESGHLSYTNRIGLFLLSGRPPFGPSLPRNRYGAPFRSFFVGLVGILCRIVSIRRRGF